jgi:hypothetical protein
MAVYGSYGSSYLSDEGRLSLSLANQLSAFHFLSSSVMSGADSGCGSISCGAFSFTRHLLYILFRVHLYPKNLYSYLRKLGMYNTFYSPPKTVNLSNWPLTKPSL